MSKTKTPTPITSAPKAQRYSYVRHSTWGWGVLLDHYYGHGEHLIIGTHPDGDPATPGRPVTAFRSTDEILRLHGWRRFTPERASPAAAAICAEIEAAAKSALEF